MSHSSGYEDDPIFQKSNYLQDISEQMRVPKRIKATGEHYSDLDSLAAPMSNGGSNHWDFHDKIDMTVPDRIVVIGQEQHLGTRSAPREIILDKSILDTNPNRDYVRVSTPPRVITLSEHHFPSASDDQFENDEQQHEIHVQKTNNNNDFNLVEARNRILPRRLLNQELSLNDREATPPLDGSISEIHNMTPSEEVNHLRRQMAKLSRRIISIEIDNIQRQQRDKIVYCIGLAYFFIRAIVWLNR